MLPGERGGIRVLGVVIAVLEFRGCRRLRGREGLGGLSGRG
jgi:hypothetical protein